MHALDSSPFVPVTRLSATFGSVRPKVFSLCRARATARSLDRDLPAGSAGMVLSSAGCSISINTEVRHCLSHVKPFSEEGQGYINLTFSSPVIRLKHNSLSISRLRFGGRYESFQNFLWVVFFTYPCHGYSVSVQVLSMRQGDIREPIRTTLRASPPRAKFRFTGELDKVSTFDAN